MCHKLYIGCSITSNHCLKENERRSWSGKSVFLPTNFVDEAISSTWQNVLTPIIKKYSCMKINEESAHVFTLPGKRYKRSNALKTSVQIDSVS